MVLVKGKTYRPMEQNGFRIGPMYLWSTDCQQRYQQGNLKWKGKSFQKMVLEQLNYPNGNKMNLNLYFTQDTKISSMDHISKCKS